MPHYSYEHAFEPGTTRAEEEELEMECYWGILCDVVIAFRFGTGRLCHVHMDETKHQIFPTNPNGDYAFDGYTIPIADQYVLLPGTRIIYLRGWNEGVWPHTVAVAFRVKTPDEMSLTELAIIEMNEVIKEVLLGTAGE